MDAPKCRTCGERHWGAVCVANSAANAGANKPANKANTANAVANKANAANTDVSMAANRLDEVLARLESVEARLQVLETCQVPREVPRQPFVFEHEEVPEVVTCETREELEDALELPRGSLEKPTRKAYMRELMRKKRAAAKLASAE